MSMPFYVAPEQVMKDRADYARKGIARGRSLIAVVAEQGIVIVAENPSTTLRKVSEIYDRIAFAGVGSYNEFDQLRIAGVRAADLKGYSFSREDVDARSLANQYAQILGQIFTHEMKPMEVEILVAEVGADADDDQLFHILYDGTVVDEHRLRRPRRRRRGHRRARGGARTWTIPTSAPPSPPPPSALAGPDRALGAAELEVALLDRNGERRCFRRLDDDEVSGYLGSPAATDSLTHPPFWARSGPTRARTAPGSRHGRTGVRRSSPRAGSVHAWSAASSGWRTSTA